MCSVHYLVHMALLRYSTNVVHMCTWYTSQTSTICKVTCIKVVPMQHFRFDTDTSIFVLILIYKFCTTNIIELTDTSLYWPILVITIHNQLGTLIIDQVVNNLGLACYCFPCVLKRFHETTNHFSYSNILIASLL